MLDTETKKRIDTARDILVGKVPDPKSQVEQITIALIYKFMDDMDKEAILFGGKATFFEGDYEKYGWTNIFDTKIGGTQMLNLYSEALVQLNQNPNIPQLFRDIFKNAYLPYRDPETLKLFLKTINEFHYDHSEKLGDAFEYLLSVLGSQGDAGQFRTPRHIIDFIVSVIQPKKTETICDPACGTAGFLISSYKHILQTNTKQNKGDLLTPDEKTNLIQNFVGYDLSPDMVRLSLVNLYLHGFTNPHIHEYDTLTSKEKWNENFDLILANPPFMTPKGGIKPHKLFSIQSNRTEVLFLDYILEHINPVHGRAGIIIPEGIMYTKKNAHAQLRKMMINSDWLYAVATLPSGVFKPYASVKTNILFIDKSLSKKAKAVLFVDIFNDGFSLSDTRKPISLNDIPTASQIISRYRDSLTNNKMFALENEEGDFAYMVTKDRIKNKPSYHLIGRWYKIDETYKGAKYPLKRLGNLCNIKQGLSPNMKTKPGKFPLVVPAPNKKTADHFDFEGNAACVPLVSSSGHGKADMKRLHYEEGQFALADTMAALFPKDEKILNAKFLYEILTHRKDKILVPLMKGAANVTMDTDDLHDVLIPVPPLETQLSIVYRNNYENIITGAKLVVKSFIKELNHNGTAKIIEENKTLIEKFERILHSTETVKEVWGE
jgi:type I restriction enzyme M protein